MTANFLVSGGRQSPGSGLHRGTHVPRSPERFQSLSCVLALLVSCAGPASAEEIFFQDGKRQMAMIETVDGLGKMTLRLPSGKMAAADLAAVNSITFRGREARAIRAGAQEFHFVSGDRLKGQIVQLSGDTLLTEIAGVGNLAVPLPALRGFLTMPVEGKAGRRAVELVTGDDEDPTGKMDQVLDRRTAGYEGVMEALTSKELLLDHERLRRTVPLNVLHLAGVRLARDTQMPRPALPSQPFVKVQTRDGSALEGALASVGHGKWHVRPAWQAGKVLAVPVEEVVAVEVLNGQAIYLSQLQPAAVQETAVLSPLQRHRLNLNCQGNPLTVAGNLHAWGIGVHANSSLTFDIGAAWTTFESTVGIDDQAGKGGSVTFQVLGDGKELYKSPVIRGAARPPTTIAVPVKGVKKLTLVVDATEDLNLGDMADWASARLVR